MPDRSLTPRRSDIRAFGLRKVAALRQLCLHLGMFDAAQHGEFVADRDTLAVLVGRILDRASESYHRAACAALLDLVLPDWRSRASPELLGNAVSRESPEVARWRRVVLKRDHGICQRCGSCEDLEAHHLIRWADDPSLRLDLDNGQTLCGSCHKRVHSRGLV